MSPLEIVKQCYCAYAEQDLVTVFSFISPAVEVTQTDDLPWGGGYRGHEGARQFFATIHQHTEATPETEHFAVAGEHVVVTGRLRGKARQSGKPIDLAFVHVWTVQDSLVVRFAAFIDAPAMRRALSRK